MSPIIRAFASIVAIVAAFVFLLTEDRVRATYLLSLATFMYVTTLARREE